MGCCFRDNKNGKINYYNFVTPLKNEDNSKIMIGNINISNNDEKKTQTLFIDSNNEEKEKNVKETKPLILFTNNDNNYIIPILQCLTYTKELTKYFLNEYDYYYNYNNKISNEYYYLSINLWKEKNISYPYHPAILKSFIYNRNSFFNNIQLNNGKDLLKYLFGNIHSELNIINNDEFNIQYRHSFDHLNKKNTFQIFYNYFLDNYNSIISDLFFGIKEIKFKCMLCGGINFKYEIFSFLEFHLKDIISDFGIEPNTALNNISKIDLYECFIYNNKKKSLTTNKFKCTKCKYNEYFEFSTSLYSLPKYLILFLNNEKEDKYYVNFPEKLDLINYLIFEEYGYKFDLYAVISKNITNSSFQNNYVTYCRNLVNYKIWYKYDNNGVKQCYNNDYLFSLPYCLFYKEKE